MLGPNSTFTHALLHVAKHGCEAQSTCLKEKLGNQIAPRMLSQSRLDQIEDWLSRLELADSHHGLPNVSGENQVILMLVSHGTLSCRVPCLLSFGQMAFPV
jgi:hypothetical protein